MASLEERSGHFRLVFRYRGKKYSHGLKTDDVREARNCKARLEENLILLERGRLQLPSEIIDLPVFLLSDGKLNGLPTVVKPTSVGVLFKSYLAGMPEGAKEPTTLATERVHLKHLCDFLKADTKLQSITTENMQAYIDARSRQTGLHGRPVSDATIRKEISTFNTVWNGWAAPQGMVTTPAPTRNLIYRKSRTKPPFQTWTEIERQIRRGGLSGVEVQELWDALFLDLQQIEEILGFVEHSCKFPFVHPMFAFAAHTGARRSEMLRSRIDDFNFESKVVRIREKKRDRTRELTYRHVPMSPVLADVMGKWFSSHPGGQFTICHVPNVPISPQMTVHHFVWALDDSKWTRLRGWHIFRHSFASNCAMKGIDQRIIDAWLGHTTEEMRRRYRHLFPDQQRRAMEMLFN
jgi:integrase